MSPVREGLLGSILTMIGPIFGSLTGSWFEVDDRALWIGDILWHPADPSRCVMIMVHDGPELFPARKDGRDWIEEHREGLVHLRRYSDVSIIFPVPYETHERLKVYAAHLGVTVEDVAKRALLDSVSPLACLPASPHTEPRS